MDKNDIYYCKLLFFSKNKLIKFLIKHTSKTASNKEEIPYFVIENDNYILSYLNSLSEIRGTDTIYMENLRAVKFKEIMLYLIYK